VVVLVAVVVAAAAKLVTTSLRDGTAGSGGPTSVKGDAVLQCFGRQLKTTTVREGALPGAIGSPARLGFNRSNINHELCHYIDDATRMATSTTNSAATLMTPPT
jgi:hypothetical protein